MRHWRQQKKTEIEVAEEQLAQECAAFLHGRFAELLETRDRAVPPWAWLNQVAHGDQEQLRALAARSQVSVRPDHRPWDYSQPMAQIAAELFWLAGEDAVALRRLQLEGLVPFEAELMMSPHPWLRTPPAVLADARASLLRAFARLAEDSLLTIDRTQRDEDPDDDPGGPR